MLYSTFYRKHTIVSLHISVLIAIWNKEIYRISNTYSWSCATNHVHCCANVIQFFCGFSSYITGNVVCRTETNQTRYLKYICLTHSVMPAIFVRFYLKCLFKMLKILLINPNMKLHGNSSTGYHAVPFRRTEQYEEANNCYSQLFGENADTWYMNLSYRHRYHHYYSMALPLKPKL